jgi:dihydroorotase
MYDLLIKGGRVIDPSQNVDGLMDVAITGGKIDLLLPDIPRSEAGTVIDAAGKTVTPGLIDMHTHVYEDVVNNGANPDAVGVNQGVTTVGDGGSAGHAIFAGFPRYVIPAARTTVYCFLHIGSFGLAVMPELWYPEEINTAATEAVIQRHPDLIKGVKIRIVGKLIAQEGLDIIRIAQDTAKKFHLPLMIHIGDYHKRVPPQLTRELLPLLEKGDVVSHYCTAQWGCLLTEKGEAVPELIAARDRGVLLDMSHGGANFAYVVARKMFSQGLYPTVITSDVNKQSLPGPSYGLTVTMSKLLAMGIPLEEMIAMTTITPAKALSIDDRKGSLKPGMDADISILEIAAGRWLIPDGNKEVVPLTRLIRPSLTVKAGVPITPNLVPIKEQVLP